MNLNVSPERPTSKLVWAVEYDGQGFYGWQWQPQLRSVQNTLYGALVQLLGLDEATAQSLGFMPKDLVASGRTDRGVHARAQVVHINLPQTLWEKAQTRAMETWVKGINALLPADINVLWAKWARGDFDARMQALGRHYRYYLLSRATRSALAQGRIGWTWQKLDLTLLQQASQMLLGTHDFSAFRDSQCQARSPVRTLRQLDVSIVQPALAEGDGTVFLFAFQANAFLHHMIRNLIGTLIEVGAGKKSLAWLEDVLQSRDRTRAGMTFMPDGLYFWQADYPDGVFLPETPPVEIHQAP